MQNELDFSPSQATDRLSDSVLEWITRTYETMEDWKAKAREVFFASNGESNVARNRVASIVRIYFTETPLEPEDVRRWKAGFAGIETIRVNPPKVSASNSAYVDWLHVADYLLLACASPSEQLDEENQRRDSDYQSVLGSYQIRLVVFEARERMKRDAKLKDDEILTDVQKSHPKAAMANIKEARRLERDNVFHAAPRAPVAAEPMPRYTSLYF